MALLQKQKAHIAACLSLFKYVVAYLVIVTVQLLLPPVGMFSAV
jgi:hypothetical protein